MGSRPHISVEYPSNTYSVTGWNSRAQANLIYMLVFLACESAP